MVETDRTAAHLNLSLSDAQLEKLNLEIESLKRGKSWSDQTVKFLPIIASIIAVSGFFFTVWQAQRNDVLAREQQEKDRINKIQSQIRSDKEQLLEFVSDGKISSVRVAFLIDDLNSLVEQLPQRELAIETNSISEQLSRVVWDLRFDTQRDVNFDVSALRRWNDFRSRWRSNPGPHHGFLARKYYPRMREIYQKNPLCIESISYDERTFSFISNLRGQGCEDGFFSILTYGFGEHLEILAETSSSELRKATDEFRQATNNSAVAEKLFSKYLPKAKE